MSLIFLLRYIAESRMVEAMQSPVDRAIKSKRRAPFFAGEQIAAQRKRLVAATPKLRGAEALVRLLRSALMEKGGEHPNELFVM